MGSTPIPSRLVSSLVAVTALVTAGACGSPGGDTDTIERDVFIETYVDLRVAALDTDSQRVATVERDEILARHGVTAEELTRFADLRGTDLEYMRDVWNEVELRLDRTPSQN